MNKNIFLSALLTLASLSAQARITDKQEQVKISGNKIELTVNSGFHFNAEAPASAQFDNQKEIAKPNPKTEKLFVFTAPEKTQKAHLKFYVCDDAKTACEQHESDVALTAGKSAEATSEVAKPAAGTTLTKSDKPTLLMFSAPWCPACIRMQTETYNQKSMVSELSHLATQKINIDLPENAELSEKYHVKAIPTAILVNKDGEEINRWLDYQPAATFSKQLHENIKNSETVAGLEKKASSGDQPAITKIGMSAYNSMNCKEAIKWLSLSHKKEDQKYKLASEVACAEEAAEESEVNKREYLSTLEKASLLTSSQLDQIRWKLDWLEKSKENKMDLKAIKAQAEKLLMTFNSELSGSKHAQQLFVNSTFGDTGGFQSEEVLLMKSRIYSILDNTTAKQAALDEIKNQIAKRKLSVQRPGEMLMAIGYLKEASEKVQVEKLYNQLIEKYPNTYVYHEKYARYLFGQKQNSKGLLEINKATNFAEGNQPQLWLLKAKIQKDLQQKTEALTTVNEILGFEKITHRKFKKILAQSETLKKDLTTDHARD